VKRDERPRRHPTIAHTFSNQPARPRFNFSGIEKGTQHQTTVSSWPVVFTARSR
jgi:hypothetical protein